MTYVDGFLLPVPTKNLAKYKKIATVAAKVWRDHGAIDYHECTGDDLKVKFGLAFPKLMKLKKGETVIFSWIVYKSKAHRAKVMAKVMQDPRIAASCDPNNMPFDVKKMGYGGFKTLVKMK